MNKILVPTDLSDIAGLGLELASEIARRCGATIRLINFTRHPLGNTFSSTGEMNLTNTEENLFTIEASRARNKKLDALARQYSAGGTNIQYAVIDDEFRDGIDTYLRDEGIDLVVMGTSGEETAQESFTGNHTLQVIKISSCPVLSVRDRFNLKDFENIVVAVSVITDNQVAEGLNIIKDISQCFNSRIHLVHVRDKASDSNLILDEYFTRMASIAQLPKFEVVILDGQDPIDGVLDYAARVNAGLIAVLKNSPAGIFRIFSNRFSNKVIREEGRPVFTVNLPNN